MPDDGELAPTTEPQTAPEAAPKRPLSLLASEAFGRDFVGEVKREERTPEAPAEPVGEREPLVPAEGTPEGEQVTTEPPEEPGEAEEQEISSFSELIQHYELDPEWANTLRVAVKVDGEAAEATLKDLVDGYQMRQAAEKRLEEAKSKAKTITEESAKKAVELDVQFSVAAKLIERAEGLLQDDTSGVDWAKLRQNDPAEYAAKREEIKERRERIQAMKQEAVESYQTGIATQKQESEAALQQRLQAESAKLLEALPDWQDVDKAKAGKAKLAEYLLGQGFAREDVLGASDHRLILMAEKARLYDAMKSSSDAAKKKVARVPKVMKPGTPKPQDQLGKEKIRKLEERARKSGSLDDALALLQARRTGGR